MYERSVCDGQRVALCEATRWPKPWEESMESEVFHVGLLSSEQILKTVFKEFSQYIIVMVTPSSWINSKNEMWWSSFAERGPFYKSLSFFLVIWGPACCSHWPARSPPPPTRPLLCLLKAANSHCRCIFSRCCIDTYQSFDPRPPVVCLRGESGLQGRRFRCCLHSPWRSSGERTQPFSQPAVSCEPLASASPLKPKKMGTRSRRSSHGPAEVVPYRASLTLKGSPCPPPGVMKRDTGRQKQSHR